MLKLSLPILLWFQLCEFEPAFPLIRANDKNLKPAGQDLSEMYDNSLQDVQLLTSRKGREKEKHTTYEGIIPLILVEP